jgi:uncharacterized protein (UPF0332 family)
VSALEFLRKSENALKSAKRDLAAGDAEGAANRLYYAMFHAARAALLSIGQSAEGKHGTIIGRFGRHFCKDGPLSSELGRAINEAQQLRAKGDYGTETPDTADVADSVAKAEAFLASVNGIVSGVPPSRSS